MASAPLPLVQSLPHGGLQAPALLRDLLALDETALYNECDLWVESIYDLRVEGPGSLAVVSSPIARAIVDVNRDADTLDDPDGAVKAQTSYGQPTWTRPLHVNEKRLLLDAHWTPYHRALEHALDGHAGAVRLLLDCHSMAQRGPATYAFAGAQRPLICLANLGGPDGAPLPGGEPTTCPAPLLRAAGALAERHFGGLHLLEPDGPPPAVVALNWPFAGGPIVRRYTKGCAPAEVSSPAPASIMIEVNRGLYVGNQHADTPPAPPNARCLADLRRRFTAWAVDLGALLDTETWG